MIYSNEKIKAFKVIVIWSDGEKLWMFPRATALDMAVKEWKDLVQVAYNPKEKVCTAKLVDLWKYLYEKKKVDKEKKKQQKQQSKWLKQIKMWYATWDNDIQLKVKKTEEFLTEWYSVKITVRLRWREKVYSSKVIEKLKQMQTTLESVGRSQYPHPKDEKNGYTITLLPIK